MLAEEIEESQLAIFKKKLKRLKEFKGRGTELISLYIPPNADRGSVMSQLTEERSQSSNIKDSNTRKNVQGALRKIDNFLKRIDFKIPKRGLAIFCGNISEQEGRSDIRLFVVEPIKPIKTKLYWCDSSFHLAPLEEMVETTDVFGLLAIDKNEATLALLKGKSYEIIGKFTSGFSGKTRAGGQSAKRFEHLREEATHEFFKRVAEKMNNAFLPELDKIKGIIIGGPGITKNYFLNQDLLDYRIKKKIIGTVDTSYTDEYGIKEIIQKSDKLLKDTELMKEKEVFENFLKAVVKTGLATYGLKETLAALEEGKVDTLLISEAIDWFVVKLRCDNCGYEKEMILKEGQMPEQKCPKCNSPLEELEDVDFIDWMKEKAEQMGSAVKLISTETAEGKQFLEGFGGIGAILRFK
ncbi:MAG: peptide chain release factor aRF-1 [Candidatus Diapherotrites archaeon]|nr:peptide chain release factor aRF-1 [Candidatus Diapherotrites archaeon]